MAAVVVAAVWAAVVFDGGRGEGRGVVGGWFAVGATGSGNFELGVGTSTIEGGGERALLFWTFCSLDRCLCG